MWGGNYFFTCPFLSGYCNRVKKTSTALLVSITWFAVIGQFSIMIVKPEAVFIPTFIGFIAYFTIQTNIMVASALTMILINTNHPSRSFIVRPSTLTAITIYITVTGLIYNMILRGIWHPEGFQKLIDELLHSFVPVAMVMYWLRFVALENISWNNIWWWLIYPAVYLGATLGYGLVVQRYPYPFVDVNALGYGRVFLNSMFVGTLFLLLSCLFVGVSKRIRKSGSNRWAFPICTASFYPIN